MSPRDQTGKLQGKKMLLLVHVKFTSEGQVPFFHTESSLAQKDIASSKAGILKEISRWERTVQGSLVNFYLQLVIFIISDPVFETLFSVHYPEGQHGQSNMKMTMPGILSSSIQLVTFAFSVWPHLSKLKCASRAPRSLSPYNRDRDKLLIPQCPLAISISWCFYSCHLQKWTNTILSLGFCISMLENVVFLQACYLNGNYKVEKNCVLPGLYWAVDARCCPRQSCWRYSWV